MSFASRLAGAAILVILVPSGAQAQGATLTVPATIPADCSTDATAALNAFFAGAPQGSVVAFPASSCYLVLGTVTVSGKRDFTVEGNGARLVRTELSAEELRYPRRNAYFRVVNGTRVSVSGLHVEGTNDGSDYGGSIPDARGAARSIDCLSYLPDWGCYSIALEFEHAFEVLGSVDTELSDVSARDIWGDGVYVAGHDQFTSQQGGSVTLTNIRVNRNGRQGIAVNRIRDVVIDGFHLERGRRSGVDLEPDTGREVISDIEIRNSTIETNLLAFASFGRGEASNVYIHDNVITRTGVPWLFVRANDGTRRYNWRVHENDVQYQLGSPQPGMLFDRVEGVDVRDNRLRFAPLQPTDAVGLYNGSTATVVCNWFRSARSIVKGDGTATWTASNNSKTTPPPVGCTAAPPSGGGGPPAPEQLQAVSGAALVELSWVDVSGDESGFEVLRSEDGVSFGVLARLDPGSSSFTDDDVVLGRLYCYEIVAYNDEGSSASDTACIVAGGEPLPGPPSDLEPAPEPLALPGAPRSLSYTLIADRVILEWLPPADGGAVESYQIQGGAASRNANLANFDTFQNATKINLKIGEGEYFIRVRARNATGLSIDSSNEIQFTVTGDPAVPNPVFVEPTLNLTSDAAGNVVVMGEVQNLVIGAVAPTFIQVHATFLSATGTVVGEDTTFVVGRSRRLRSSGVVTDTALLSGQRGCFMMSTNVPASRVDTVTLSTTFDTFTTDSLEGRLRVAEYAQQADGGNLQMAGTASNVGTRRTHFNTVILDVKTPKVQTCDFALVDGSTVTLPSGEPTSTALAPGETGNFTSSTGIPFQPMEVRRYTQWDEVPPDGVTGAEGALVPAGEAEALAVERFERARTRFRRLMSGPGTPSQVSAHYFFSQAQARLREIERDRAGESYPDDARLADRITLRMEPGQD